MTVKIVIFVILALFIFFKFRRGLRSLTNHGFYMFFAFEALLVLLFFNIDFWISRAFTWYQILSWISLVASALLALIGFYSLKKYGKSIEGWEDTTHLITQGIFRCIRHPLYSSLILLSIGFLLKNVTLQSIVACFISIVSLMAASKVEERENLAKFGSPYNGYKKVTKRYIPFIF